MAGLPYYRIKDCCTSQEALININPATPITADGIYKWTNADFSFMYGPNNQITFTLEQNRCYIITFRGTSLTLTYPTIAATGLQLEMPGTYNECSQATNCDCNSGNWYIKADPCCTGEPPVYFKGEGFPNYPALPQFDINQYPAVWRFNGWQVQGQQPPLPPGIGQELTLGACYRFSINTVTAVGSEVTLAQWQTLPYPPFISQLSFSHKDLCPPDFLNPDVPCSPCDEICYVLTACNGLIIQTTLDFSNYVGTYITLSEHPGLNFLVDINEGLCVNPDTTLDLDQVGVGEQCPCLCYEVIGQTGSINYIDCDGNGQVTFSPAKFCAQAPPIIKEIPGATYTLVTGSDCINNECPAECFTLINCDPDEYPNQPAIISSTLQSLSQYANTGQIVVLTDYDGCWQVEEATCQCITVNINGTAYSAKATSVYNGKKVFTFTYETVTYYIWSGAFPGSWFITQEIGVTSVSTELGQIAAGILDCPVAEEGIWIKGQGPSGESITSLNTGLCDDQCDCPVDVTVIRDYRDCKACTETEVGVEAYKLTNCEKINEVLYTVQDLSAYVGKVIKDDCACWTVERIFQQPPSTTVINNIIAYEDCTSCLTTYYQLDNCDITATPLQIITSTDLSDYIDKVVQVEGCVGCYTVSLYTRNEEPAAHQTVEVTSSFDDCSTCTDIPPRCSTVFNSSITDQVYTFVNANGDLETTGTIRSGEASLRFCVQKWVLDPDVDQGGIFNYYGDCSVFEEPGLGKTGFCKQYFPNDRKVKPGYNTPICSADKYDKITCNFADAAYKSVLELRYGISNCCPEDDEKWIIQKELIELQALTDPNYTCDPLTDCCSNPSTDCSCNS